MCTYLQIYHSIQFNIKERVGFFFQHYIAHTHLDQLIHVHRGCTDTLWVYNTLVGSFAMMKIWNLHENHIYEIYEILTFHTMKNICYKKCMIYEILVSMKLWNQPHEKYHENDFHVNFIHSCLLVNIIQINMVCSIWRMYQSIRQHARSPIHTYNTNLLAPCSDTSLILTFPSCLETRNSYESNTQ